MARPQELPYYQHFKGLVPELAGAADDLGNESPDVIASLPGRKIGIELTGYYHGAAPKGGAARCSGRSSRAT